MGEIWGGDFKSYLNENESGLTRVKGWKDTTIYENGSIVIQLIDDSYRHHCQIDQHLNAALF